MTYPTSRTLWARFLKRGFDMAGATVLVILLTPFLFLAAVLIKSTSRGPVFFIQARAGRHGHIFRVTKLRTMRGGRRPDPEELVPLNHPEITPLGRFLRRFKIDELPQLWNVLRGEMSLIGPRPTLPEQVKAYDEFRRQRLLVRPGITGLAQVYANAAVPWDERILYDIAYVRACSFALDFRIMLRTLLVLIRGEEGTTRQFAETCFARHVRPPAGYGGKHG